MPSLKGQLTEIFSKAFADLGLEPGFGQVTDSQRPDLAQFQCNGALGASKKAGKNPQEIAERVMKIVLPANTDIFSGLSMAGPGFINIILSDAFLTRFNTSIYSDPRHGCDRTAQPQSVIVDFGGPNVAKPMHVGHLRSALIGDALQRLGKFTGDSVIGDNHLGDWGTPMGMLISEFLSLQSDPEAVLDGVLRGEFPQPGVTVADLQDLYVKASNRCKADEVEMRRASQITAELQAGHPGYTALWKHFVDISVNEMRRDFERLGIKFDYWLGESHYHPLMAPLVDRLKAAGVAEESQGAVVILVAEEKDPKEVPPLLLVKSDGGFLYGTSDLATLMDRKERLHADRVVYVVDKRQSLHFQQVFRAARKAGLADGMRLDHAGFGTVNGPDGKPFKTRAGGVMRLSDLISLVTEKAFQRMEEAGIGAGIEEAERRMVAEKVGLGALKFADLSNHRLSDYVFDVDKFTQFEGRTGPYLLYTAVRIQSILRKAAEQGLSPDTPHEVGDSERSLVLRLAGLSESVSKSYEQLAPNILCDFAFNLCAEFNRFYKDCHILREPDKARQASWLGLSRLCLSELQTVLGILGMEIPERM